MQGHSGRDWPWVLRPEDFDKIVRTRSFDHLVVALVTELIAATRCSNPYIVVGS